MISVKTAELYTSEQRKDICKWCKEKGGGKCASCGITQTAPKPPREERIKRGARR